MVSWCKSSADSLPISYWPSIVISISRKESASTESENYGLTSKMKLRFRIITPQTLASKEIMPMQKPNRTLLRSVALLQGATFFELYEKKLPKGLVIL